MLTVRYAGHARQFAMAFPVELIEVGLRKVRLPPRRPLLEVTPPTHPPTPRAPACPRVPPRAPACPLDTPAYVCPVVREETWQISACAVAAAALLH